MQELDLEKIRQEIDKVDQQLADVLESRLQLVMQVAAYKKSKGLPVKDKNREAKVIEKVAGFLENKEYSVDNRLHQAFIMSHMPLLSATVGRHPTGCRPRTVFCYPLADTAPAAEIMGAASTEVA